MKTPIVARKTMEDRLSLVRFEHQREISDLQEKHQEEMEEMRKDLNFTIERLTKALVENKIKVSSRLHGDKGSNYSLKLVVELDLQEIAMDLKRDEMILWIGKYVGSAVSVELKKKFGQMRPSPMKIVANIKDGEGMI